MEKTRRLTQWEFEAFRELLLEVKTINGFSIEEVDGFFTALVCLPGAISPIDYLCLVKGDEQKCVKLVGEAGVNKLNSLIIKYATYKTSCVVNGVLKVTPVLNETSSIPSAQEWASAFLVCTRTDPRWEALFTDDYGVELITPILFLASGKIFDDNDNKISMANDERDVLISLLPETVDAIYGYMRQVRRNI